MTAHAILRQYLQEWSGNALVSCQITRPPSDQSHVIGTLECGWPTCRHDPASFVHVLMPPAVWQAIGPDKPVTIVEAKILWNEGIPVVDLRSPQSGIMLQQPANRQPDSLIRVGEFFAGGFSGWSYAVKALEHAHLPIQHVFSVENDAIMARCHALNQSSYPAISSPAQASENGLDGKTLEEPLTVQANVEYLARYAWWHYLFKPIDVLLASPPCQPWSRASSELGLGAPDGRLLVMTLVQCFLLQPAIL